MYRIIDGRSSGKTGRLMLLAKENNGILVCSNPDAMRYKSYSYGLVGFDIISYHDYIVHDYEDGKPIFIDELEKFAQSISGLNKLEGYSLTNED